MINGICLISLHSLTQLELDYMKAMMGEIMNLIGDNDNENGNRRKRRKNYLRKNNDFRSFLNVLEKENDLIRINKTVSTKFEIQRSVSAEENKASIT